MGSGFTLRRQRLLNGSLGIASIALKKELLAEMETPFAKGGYRVVGVTVEKVLVGGFREVPLYQGEMAPGRVPYDAQVWFRLEKN